MMEQIVCVFGLFLVCLTSAQPPAQGSGQGEGEIIKRSMEMHVCVEYID